MTFVNTKCYSECGFNFQNVLYSLSVLLLYCISFSRDALKMAYFLLFSYLYWLLWTLVWWINHTSKYYFVTSLKTVLLFWSLFYPSVFFDVLLFAFCFSRLSAFSFFSRCPGVRLIWVPGCNGYSEDTVVVVMHSLSVIVECVALLLVPLHIYISLIS